MQIFHKNRIPSPSYRNPSIILQIQHIIPFYFIPLFSHTIIIIITLPSQRLFQQTSSSITLKHLPIKRQHLRHRLRHIIKPRRHRQDLQSRLRHQHRMLKLRRPLPIRRDDRPIVRPSLIVPISLVNHRFDRENHPGSHRSLRVVVYFWAFRAPIRR